MPRATAITFTPAQAERLRALGRRVRALRTYRQLTLEGLASQTGLARSTVESVERGALTTSIGAYLVVLDALGAGMDIDRLVGDQLQAYEGEPSPDGRPRAGRSILTSHQRHPPRRDWVGRRTFGTMTSPYSPRRNPWARPGHRIVFSQTEVSSRRPTQADFSGFHGAHSPFTWHAVAANWRCPCCDRSKFDLLRWTLRKVGDAPPSFGWMALIGYAPGAA